MSPSADAPSDDLAVVRALWDAMRERDVDAAMELMHQEVELIPMVIEGGPVRGTEALRQYAETIVGTGMVTDAYQLGYEDLGDGRVLMRGALRVRRPDHWLETVERWWIYAIEDGRIRRVQACETREAALAVPRPS